MGGFRLQQDQDAAAKFYYPFLKATEVRIADGQVRFCIILKGAEESKICSYGKTFL
jgi:hypothetical protein